MATAGRGDRDRAAAGLGEAATPPRLGPWRPPLGLRPVRTLQVLGRSLSGDLPPAEPPAGITIRTFRPGLDEDGWLAVNARAFAFHPEQGSLTRTDLEQRMAEPWFDPAGFFVAVRDDPADGAPGDGTPIVGFHWTKREPGSPTGEVYVIGVDPAAGVRGLGTPLLGVGLRHLREVGASEVDLYVEADNDARPGALPPVRFLPRHRRRDVRRPGCPAETSG